MRAPEFWWRDAPSLAARVLSPVGALYGAIAARRMARDGARGALPVVCVGNLVAGGAGKTPTAIALAKLLAETGERPTFLTRGYGGRLAGPVAADRGAHTARDVGDEPLLLARLAPTIVSRDRVAGARLAAELGASVIVMDDGLQNASLAKDLALAVVDAERGIGNRLSLPAGPLRAPLHGQLAHVDAVIIIGEGAAGLRVAEVANRVGVAVLTARLVPEPQAARALQGQRVIAFAGIGRPEKFFAMLDVIGAIVVERLAFPDHHPFTAKDIDKLARLADAQQLLPVTTEKDAVRLGPEQRAALGLAVLPVSLRFEDEAGMRKLLTETLRQRCHPVRAAVRMG